MDYDQKTTLTSNILGSLLFSEVGQVPWPTLYIFLETFVGQVNLVHFVSYFCVEVLMGQVTWPTLSCVF